MTQNENADAANVAALNWSGNVEAPPILDSRLPTNINSGNRASRFVLTALADLIAEPEEEVSYVWDRTLPSGGLSICASKPKVGKSTVARNLAVAVARGTDFLGRSTTKGRVVYLCLEEKRAEVAAHFRCMGACNEDIYIHTGPTPKEAVEALAVVVEQKKPLLTIIDPMSRLLRLQEYNSYGDVNLALEPLIDLARASGCHILLLHHSGKVDREGGDAVLGSTGFFGGVDSLLEMKRRSNVRTLQTTQRYGEDMPQTIVQLDADTGIITAGGDVQGLQSAEYEGKVLEAVGEQNLAEPDIKESVGGNQTLTAKAIRSLCHLGRLERTGTGRKGDPYLYGPALSPMTEERAEKKSMLDSADIDNRESGNNSGDEPQA